MAQQGVIESWASCHILTDYFRRTAIMGNVGPRLARTAETDIRTGLTVKNGRTITKSGQWVATIVRSNPASDWPYDLDINVDGVTVWTGTLNPGDCAVGPRADWEGGATFPNGEGAMVPRIVPAKTTLQFVARAGGNTGLYWFDIGLIRLDY